MRFGTNTGSWTLFSLLANNLKSTQPAVEIFQMGKGHYVDIIEVEDPNDRHGCRITEVMEPGTC